MTALHTLSSIDGWFGVWLFPFKRGYEVLFSLISPISTSRVIISGFKYLWKKEINSSILSLLYFILLNKDSNALSIEKTSQLIKYFLWNPIWGSGIEDKLNFNLFYLG